MPRYIILGAGAVGGALGGRLVLAGRDVVLVARGNHLAALREHGLRLRTPDEDVTHPVLGIGGPQEIGLSGDDILILATKTHQANEALVTWADAPVYQNARPIGTAGEHLPIFIALNGVAAEAMAHRYFRRVYGICVWMPVVHLRPGEVIIRSTPQSGMLHIGRVPANDHDQTLQQVATDLVAANFDVPLPEDVMSWKYRKLISNIGNVFQALVACSGDWRPLVADAEAEARRVLDAAGIAYIGEEEEAAARAAGFTLKPVAGVDEFVGGSTWQSLQRGTGNIETDYLNGEIVMIAHRIGMEAPINEQLAILARRAATNGAKPGDINVDQLTVLLQQ
ncbi:MAG TPA: 2-dehydropantoate 2-reductase N-terminal domain-containing protein [Propionibacteriaceae bacterium]|jgi:2-dehydropantoate 2-reductase|nr:2-dehydropantoate 2-reductase N-terminal domain-containing protein [Propionibacteriaceae bacterium]